MYKRKLIIIILYWHTCIYNIKAGEMLSIIIMLLTKLCTHL